LGPGVPGRIMKISRMMPPTKGIRPSRIHSPVTPGVLHPAPRDGQARQEHAQAVEAVENPEEVRLGDGGEDGQHDEDNEVEQSEHPVLCAPGPSAEAHIVFEYGEIPVHCAPQVSDTSKTVMLANTVADGGGHHNDFQAGPCPAASRQAVFRQRPRAPSGSRPSGSFSQVLNCRGAGAPHPHRSAAAVRSSARRR